jgi:hypothetical protein
LGAGNLLGEEDQKCLVKKKQLGTNMIKIYTSSFITRMRKEFWNVVWGAHEYVSYREQTRQLGDCQDLKFFACG